jgi:hypothetical protein
MNKVHLKGKLYLVDANRVTQLSNNPLIECVVATGPKYLLQHHKVLITRMNAVKTLAHIRANNDQPVEVWIEGKLFYSPPNQSSFVQCAEIDYLSSEFVTYQADALLRKLKNGDSFLAASFRKTADNHSEQLRLLLLAGEPCIENGQGMPAQA